MVKKPVYSRPHSRNTSPRKYTSPRKTTSRRSPSTRKTSPRRSSPRQSLNDLRKENEYLMEKANINAQKLVDAEMELAEAEVRISEMAEIIESGMELADEVEKYGDFDEALKKMSNRHSRVSDSLNIITRHSGRHSTRKVSSNEVESAIEKMKRSSRSNGHSHRRSSSIDKMRQSASVEPSFQRGSKKVRHTVTVRRSM